MYTYLEIVKYDSIENEVMKRIDVTGKGPNYIDRVDRGININLNHEEFFTREIESKTELPTI